ncbi:hypothetical protein CONCODRAFT_9166 [Conidiobolus coronatus NRRL 28638]|uniref:Uncharacterized protein n=1 Tax=Conidiobolus coronatus (strain ATCC 28846 / CBS 209.66 / NRRL 28638) TaxID=796925 RepID=A0A137P0F1_CONC2|nr:hypothetical protein CONCODRAFT_9166 [Conidiobolus coronatus NRRL 28638]|eukprot:KXN68570.1 hypothetical protein CONCODRAFT_9166 [Conidiobolus coronatus NRRL 28638]
MHLELRFRVLINNHPDSTDSNCEDYEYDLAMHICNCADLDDGMYLNLRPCNLRLNDNNNEFATKADREGRRGRELILGIKIVAEKAYFCCIRPSEEYFKELFDGLPKCSEVTLLKYPETGYSLDKLDERGLFLQCLNSFRSEVFSLERVFHVGDAQETRTVFYKMFDFGGTVEWVMKTIIVLDNLIAGCYDKLAPKQKALMGNYTSANQDSYDIRIKEKYESYFECGSSRCKDRSTSN